MKERRDLVKGFFLGLWNFLWQRLWIQDTVRSICSNYMWTVNINLNSGSNDEHLHEKKLLIVLLGFYHHAKEGKR